jgi:hypothetical protein
VDLFYGLLFDGSILRMFSLSGLWVPFYKKYQVSSWTRCSTWDSFINIHYIRFGRDKGHNCKTTEMRA